MRCATSAPSKRSGSRVRTPLDDGSNVVDREESVGVAAAGYDGESVVVITNSIEADRSGDEQLPEGVAVSAFA